MIILILLSAIISTVVSVLLIRWARGHARQYAGDKPQRFHTGDIPRIGGAAVLVGLIFGWILTAFDQKLGLGLNTNSNWPTNWPWILIVLPSVLGGIFEDLTQRVSVRYRLVLTALSALLACYLLNLSVERIGFPMIDSFMAQAPWVGIALAVIAICGLPHAFNIIDGYNGLAPIVAILISFALIHVSLQLGDRQLAAILVALSGATFGFLIWNYPRGLIFAGDGGAYLWGIVIAAGSIALVQRHQEVSPWFPMLLLIYPVWETIFSMYRKSVRGVSPGVADALHFHQLIYRRIVRGVFDDDEARKMLMRNNRTSPYLWSFTLLTVAPAVIFWNNSWVLLGFCILFVITYVSAYLMLVRFKVPNWLRR